MKDERRATVRSAHANRPASYSLMGLSTVARFVSTSSGPAQWNAETKMIELTGSPSFDFSEPSK